MVGRAVLVDAFKLRADDGRPLNPLDAEEYSVADLQGAIDRQGVQLKPGDFLLVRTGWLSAYLASSAEDKAFMGKRDNLRSCGIEPTREMAAWLWDSRVSAIAMDCPAAETWPWDMERGPLHYRTLGLLGLPLGEQFNLEELAADCHGDGVYEGMLVSAPLNLRGGIASPPNAVVIK